MAPRPTKKSPGSTTPQPPPRPDLPVQARHPPPPGLPATAPRPTAVVGRVAELMGGKGVDSRFVVTNLAGTPRWLYEAVYCARGQAENLVKAHKLHLASDRTSCTKATANQFRLVLHTAAYWLLHTLRGLAPKRS